MSTTITQRRRFCVRCGQQVVGDITYGLCSASCYRAKHRGKKRKLRWQTRTVTYSEWVNEAPTLEGTTDG